MNTIRIRRLRRAGALLLLLLALLPFSAQRAAADYTAATLPAWAIGPFTRYAGNPILTPQGTGWESFNVFNPAVEVDHSTFHLLYRAEATTPTGFSRIGYAWSSDGYHYTRYGSPVLTNDHSYDAKGLEDPRLITLNGVYYAYYLGISSDNSFGIQVATSTDFIHWTKYGMQIPNTRNPDVVMDPSGHPVQINGKYVMFYGGASAGTSCYGQGCGVYVAYSTDLIHWSGNTPVDMHFPDTYKPYEVCVAVTDYPTIAGGPLNHDIVVFVAGELMGNGQWYYAISETLFSRANPTQQLAQLSDAIVKPTAPYELTGYTNHTVFMDGITFYNGQWWLPYGAADHVTALATARLRPAAAFSSGLEGGDPQPTWTNSVDSGPGQGGGLANVGGICCGLTGPQLGVRYEIAHTGSAALMYSGLAKGGSATRAYLKAFDLSAHPLPVGPSTTLSYWIYPQSATGSHGLASGTNSTCVALDLIFTDGTPLRNLGVTDQNGVPLHPANQCGHLALDTWNHVTANLGRLAGKSIARIDVGYDHPGSTGGYRGYVDDIAISQ